MWTEQQKVLAILVGSFWGRDNIALTLGLSPQNTWEDTLELGQGSGRVEFGSGVSAK